MKHTYPERCGDTAHNNGDEVVEVTIGGGSEFQGLEADFVKSFVINAEGLIGVLDKLVHRQGGVVRLEKFWSVIVYWFGGQRSSPRQRCRTPFRTGISTCLGFLLSKRIPSGWARRSMCTSYDLGNPHGSWRSGGYPYQRQYHRRASG